MNQKLRTARSGIVIIFAVLCIVCLSLSLALSAHFAAYAEGESATLAANDGKGHDLWLVHYEGCEAAGESLWNGNRNGEPISYIDSISGEDGSHYYGVCKGGEEENFFAPYRGKELTLKLNPNYEIDGKRLGELYDLENAEYIGNSAIGGADLSSGMLTRVTAQALPESGITEALQLDKEWKIATLCNLVDVQGTYISDRGYAVNANYDWLRPALGDTVVYDLSSVTGYERIVAVKYGQNGEINYLQAGKDEQGYFVTEDSWDKTELDAAADENVSLINYLIRRLDALVADTSAGIDAYTLTVAAMPYEAADGIMYSQSRVSYKFNVVPQGLGNDAENDTTFENNFNFTIENASVEYAKDSQWIASVGLKLWLNGILLEEGKDYNITSDSDSVGLANLCIVGSGNLSGSHTIRERVRINPARNDWEVLPNIVSWMYGTYKAENNLILGRPVLLDNPQDIAFSIVSLVKDSDGNVKDEVIIDALSDIHYYVDPTTGETNWIVTDDVIAVLGKLNVGDYRLYASVYGVNSTDPTLDRNYQPISRVSVDFKIFEGVNRWKAGSEPSINGWTAGKLNTTDDLMNAESVFGTPVLMIYDIEDNLIYSNLPRHANTEFGDINVLKGLKAGRYYLSAVVEGTDNYAELRSTVIFDVVPNNLPIWAVILIVVGSLAIVAVIFIILHQKGVLQMLTGKVIISMRTRANVDATLAAIRAAKVARDAEASIAAAKAREAEEQAKAEEKHEDK